MNLCQSRTRRKNPGGQTIRNRRSRGSKIARMNWPAGWNCWRQSVPCCWRGAFDEMCRASGGEGSGYCRNCGKPMCAVCVRPVHEVLYCEECLAHVMGVPAPQAAESVGAQAAPDAQGTV